MIDIPLCLLQTFFSPSPLVCNVDSQNDTRHPWLIFPNECGNEHMYDQGGCLFLIPGRTFEPRCTPHDNQELMR